MRKTILSVGLAAVLACAASGAWAQDKPDKASQKFLKNAIEGNLAEIEMGKLAQHKAQNDAVKSFGQTLVTDHGSANQKASSIAQQMNVTPPSEPNRKQKNEYQRLSKLSGDKFDKAFAKHMVTDHKKDISAFEKEAKKNDAAGQFAKDTLPTLRKHLETAQSLDKPARAQAR
jgi:putative membrane protein